MCTPAGANVELLRACARRGVRAAFLTSAGYGEAGDDGVRAQRELVALADELGILLAGPNGQGVVSTPAHLCAQIVAPYPPAGRIAIASQSGNFVSSFENWAVQTGVGVSRAVSAGQRGRGRRRRLPRLVRRRRRHRGEPRVRRRRRRRPRAVRAARRGRAAQAGRAREGRDDRERAARRPRATPAASPPTTASSTACAARPGITRAATIEEAFEAAATFATQPLPRGPRTAVLTTAGGWGVVTADAIARAPGLELAALPDDLRAAIDEKLPPRWSRNNPIDFAGGETRDTIPEVMELVARHPDDRRDRLPRPRHPVEPGAPPARRRVLSRPRPRTHRRVPRASGRALRGGRGRDLRRDRQADPHRDRARGRRTRQPRARRPSARPGALCYPSANRAVVALAHLWHDARFRHRPRADVT